MYLSIDEHGVIRNKSTSKVLGTLVPESSAAPVPTRVCELRLLADTYGLPPNTVQADSVVLTKAFEALDGDFRSNYFLSRVASFVSAAIDRTAVFVESKPEQFQTAMSKATLAWMQTILERYTQIPHDDKVAAYQAEVDLAREIIGGLKDGRVIATRCSRVTSIGFFFSSARGSLVEAVRSQSSPAQRSEVSLLNEWKDLDSYPPFDNFIMSMASAVDSWKGFEHELS